MDGRESRAGVTSNNAGNQQVSDPGDLPKLTEMLKSLQIGEKKNSSKY